MLFLFVLCVCFLSSAVERSHCRSNEALWLLELMGEKLNGRLPKPQFMAPDEMNQFMKKCIFFHFYINAVQPHSLLTLRMSAAQLKLLLSAKRPLIYCLKQFERSLYIAR